MTIVTLKHEFYHQMKTLKKTILQRSICKDFEKKQQVVPKLIYI